MSDIWVKLTVKLLENCQYIKRQQGMILSTCIVGMKSLVTCIYVNFIHLGGQVVETEN